MIDISNPGNLRPLPAGELWLGQTGTFPTSDGLYCTFDTPMHGIRALAKNLRAYKHEVTPPVTTILGFAQRWAPGEDHNSPSSYASFVASALGISITDPIDLDDGDTLVGMAKAITIMENGHPVGPEDAGNGNWYADAVFIAGVNAAFSS